MKIFLDTNLILDVLAERQPFYENSRRIWELVEKRDLTGHLSATTITDIFDIIKKQLGMERAYETIGKILAVFNIISVSETDIKKALNLGLKDFEDALQLVCAKKIKAKYLITRNREDFPTPVWPVISPMVPHSAKYFRRARPSETFSWGRILSTGVGSEKGWAVILKWSRNMATPPIGWKTVFQVPCQ